jgi:hypothetical protein
VRQQGEAIDVGDGAENETDSACVATPGDGPGTLDVGAVGLETARSREGISIVFLSDSCSIPAGV